MVADGRRRVKPVAVAVHAARNQAKRAGTRIARRSPSALRRCAPYPPLTAVAAAHIVRLWVGANAKAVVLGRRRVVAADPLRAIARLCADACLTIPKPDRLPRAHPTRAVSPCTRPPYNMSIEFKSPIAQRWVTNYLYFHDIIERFAQHLTPEAYMWHVGQDETRLGTYVRSIAEEVMFIARITVELNPVASEAELLSKENVIDMLEKGRGALTRALSNLSETRVSQPRFTPLLGEESTLVESIVMLMAKVQYLFGRASQVAAAHGAMFDVLKSGEYPHPMDVRREARPGKDTQVLEPGREG